jgi:penicillin amidase
MLQAPVSIKRSSDGIVYINAQYDADMLFARGWVMAEDRLGQLCMYRRIARGTLSSVLGVTAYPTDVFFRTVNFRQKAIEEWNRLPEDIRTAITHTIDGINAFIVERNKTATPAQMSGDAANAWSPELLILG